MLSKYQVLPDHRTAKTKEIFPQNQKILGVATWGVGRGYPGSDDPTFQSGQIQKSDFQFLKSNPILTILHCIRYRRVGFAHQIRLKSDSKKGRTNDPDFPAPFTRLAVYKIQICPGIGGGAIFA